MEWWDRALLRFRPYIVLDEVARGDAGDAEPRLARIATFPVLAVRDDVREFAARYFTAIALPERARADAFHLALAAGHGVDYLVSWNCGHIASGRVRSVLETVNERIRTSAICLGPTTLTR